MLLIGPHQVRGPLILFQAVYPLLERAKEGKYLVISSDRGSIGQKHMAGEFAYGQSKVSLDSGSSWRYR